MSSNYGELREKSMDHLLKIFILCYLGRGILLRQAAKSKMLGAQDV
jgi:hypothetical protein